MTQINAESFAFLVDVATRDEPMIGLRITTISADEYIVPMSLETAHNVGSVLLNHVAALHATTEKATTHA